MIEGIVRAIEPLKEGKPIQSILEKKDFKEILKNEKNEVIKDENTDLIENEKAEDIESVEDETLKEEIIALMNMCMNIVEIKDELENINVKEGYIKNEKYLKSINDGLEKIFNSLKEHDGFKEIKEKSLIISKALGKEKEKKIDLIIDKLLGEKGISIKKLIEKIEKTFKEEGIGNFGEMQEDQNLDIKTYTAIEKEVKVKNDEKILKPVLEESKKDEKVLASILEGESFKEEYSLFNKKLEALKGQEMKDNNLVVRKSNLEVDLVKSIKFINRDSLKEITVKVYPRELGEIVISISKDEDVLKANLKANTKDTYNIISQNANELKKLLSEAGIKIESLDIGLYEDTTFYKDGDFSKEKRESLEHKENFNMKRKDEVLEEEIKDDILNILA